MRKAKRKLIPTKYVDNTLLLDILEGDKHMLKILKATAWWAKYGSQIIRDKKIRLKSPDTAIEITIKKMLTVGDMEILCFRKPTIPDDMIEKVNQDLKYKRRIRK